MTPPDKPGETHVSLPIPASLTLKMNPDLRQKLGRLVRNEGEKIRAAGSLLADPSPQDVLRGLIEREAAVVDATDRARDNVAYMASRPLDQTRIQPASFVPNAPEFQAVADVLAQSHLGECGSEVTQDDPTTGQPETFTCRHKKGHPGNHEDAGLEWYDRPAGGTFTHRKADGGEGGVP